MKFNKSIFTKSTRRGFKALKKEIVKSSIDCWQAGAAIVRIHVRDSITGLGSQDLKLFRQVVGPLRGKTDLVLCLMTSGIAGRNLPIEQRLAPLELKPELASFDIGFNLWNLIA